MIIMVRKPPIVTFLLLLCTICCAQVSSTSTKKSSQRAELVESSTRSGSKQKPSKKSKRVDSVEESNSAVQQEDLSSIQEEGSPRRSSKKSGGRGQDTQDPNGSINESGDPSSIPTDSFVYEFMLSVDTEQPVYVVLDTARIRGEEVGTYEAQTIEEEVFSFEILEILLDAEEMKELSNEEDADLDDTIDFEEAETYDMKWTYFYGRAEDDIPFMGIAFSAVDYRSGDSVAYFMVVDDAVIDEPPIDDSDRRLVDVNFELDCAAIFDAAVDSVPCLSGESLSVNSGCRSQAIKACNNLVSEEHKRAQMALKAFKYTRMAQKCFLSKNPFKFVAKKNPWVLASCLALGTAKIEWFALTKAALKEAYEQGLIDNGTIIAASTLLAKACFDCEEPPSLPPVTIEEPPSLPPVTIEEPQTTPPVTRETPDSDPPPTAGSGGYLSGTFGDPHISTFDRLRFAANIAGVVTTVTSLESPEFKIQETFTKIDSNSCSTASISTAVAICEPGLPTIQISTPTGDDSAGSEAFQGCPIDLVVDGQFLPLSSGIPSDDITLLRGVNTLTIQYRLTGVRIQVRVRKSSNFGCNFRIQVFLPYTYRADETIIGLLGVPNGNRSDDWRTPEGDLLPLPNDSDELNFEAAHVYSSENWCVRDEDQSIMTFRPDTPFDAINGCDDGYDDAVKRAVANAPASVLEACGESQTCVMDAVCGSLEDGLVTLADEAETTRAQEENSGCDLNVAECCKPSDCATSFTTCTDQRCVKIGNLRFTLSWTGDDDLDLRVLTPLGRWINYSNRADSESGGFLDADDIPRQVGSWVENIVFGEGYPRGIYTFLVSNYRMVGSADPWTLRVFLGEEEVASYSGATLNKARSEEFNYDAL